MSGEAPVDIDGHTIDELQDYLDAGRRPQDPSIEGSAACLIALDAMLRLRRASVRLFESDVASLPPVDESWIAMVMSSIGREVRSGRRVPLSAQDEHSDLAVNESALLGLMRSAGDEDPDVLVGRCTLEGELGTPDAVIRVRATIAVRWGRPLQEAADAARERILRALERHTRLTIERVDVHVDDLWGMPAGRERE